MWPVEKIAKMMQLREGCQRYDHFQPVIVRFLFITYSIVGEVGFPANALQTIETGVHHFPSYKPHSLFGLPTLHLFPLQIFSPSIEQ